jgi:fructokinase
MHRFKVAGIGELLWDLLPQGKQLGGAPCNFAYHAFQADCQSYVISTVGADDAGDDIITRFNELGLDHSFVQRTSDFPTGTVTVSLDVHGIPTYNIHENVAWDNIALNGSLETLAKSVDAVCFGSLAQRNCISRQTILKFLETTRPDCLRIFDINLRQSFYTKNSILRSLELATILKLNDDELPVVAKLLGFQGNDIELLTQLRQKFGLKLVAFTRGDKGSLLLTENEQSVMEVPKVKISDTVGAGDSFTAILVAGLLQKHGLKRIHETATLAAAFVCTQIGATPKLPETILNLYKPQII